MYFDNKISKVVNFVFYVLDIINLIVNINIVDYL